MKDASKQGLPMHEAKDDDLLATMELCAAPGMQQKIIEGLHTKVEDCLPMDKVLFVCVKLNNVSLSSRGQCSEGGNES